VSPGAEGAPGGTFHVAERGGLEEAGPVERGDLAARRGREAVPLEGELGARPGVDLDLYVDAAGLPRRHAPEGDLRVGPPLAAEERLGVDLGLEEGVLPGRLPLAKAEGRDERAAGDAGRRRRAHGADERDVVAGALARAAELDPLLERAAEAAVVLRERLHREGRQAPQAVDVDDPGLPLRVLQVDPDRERDVRREVAREREARGGVGLPEEEERAHRQGDAPERRAERPRETVPEVAGEPLGERRGGVVRRGPSRTPRRAEAKRSLPPRPPRSTGPRGRRSSRSRVAGRSGGRRSR
jgi:hypothetical protein